MKTNQQVASRRLSEGNVNGCFTFIWRHPVQKEKEKEKTVSVQDDGGEKSDQKQSSDIFGAVAAVEPDGAPPPLVLAHLLLPWLRVRRRRRRRKAG